MQENQNKFNNQIIRSQHKCLSCERLDHYQKCCPYVKERDQYDREINYILL